MIGTGTNNTIHYTHCPVCHSTNISNRLPAKDHTVSGESFWIAQCNDCSLRLTQDVPDAESILPYYRSESYISHSNTSKGLINRLYQIIRRKTMRSKRKLVCKQTGLAVGKLLDLGSGIGSFAATMKEAGWEVTGLEPDEQARQVAKQEYGMELFPINQFLQLSPASFDAITLWHVLEHVHDLHPYIQRLRTLLRPEGRIFIAVPNYTSLDAAIYKAFWAAYDVPRHLYHFSPASMELLVKKNGLQLKEVRPMWYDSFYISLLSSKYKHGKSNLFAAVWNGLRSNLKAMKDPKRSSSVIYIVSM